MQNLIYFLLQYGYILLFVLLQILSLHLVVRFNEHQKNIFLSSTTQASGWIDSRVDKITSYFKLADVSKDLARENATLQKELREVQQSSVGQLKNVADSINRQKYILMPAKVISNNITSVHNYIGINQGSLHGIREGMGIVTRNGIVGIITEVSKNYAKAISVLNQDFRASVRIRDKGFFGYLHWEGGDPTRISLVDIPKHAQIETGDIVCTSGYSTIFPSGINLGAVEKFNLMDGSNFYSVTIKLDEDIAALHYVYVVDNLMKEEQFDVTNTKDP